MNWKSLKNQDWIITIIALIIQLIGLVAIYSTTVAYGKFSYTDNMVLKQLVFIIVGFGAYFLISLIDFSWLKQPGILAIIYIFTILLLVYVKFFGTDVRDVNRWISFGFFNIQPSEYAKIVIILITAAVFSINEQVIEKTGVYFSRMTTGKSKTIKAKFLELLAKIRENFPLLNKYIINSILILPIIFFTFIQPALGSAAIMFLIWIIILYISFPNPKGIFSFLALSILFAILVFNLFEFKSVYDFQTKSSDIAVTFLLSNINILLLIATIISIIGIILFFKTKIQLLIFSFLIVVSLIFGTVIAWNHILINYQKDRVEIFLEGPETDPSIHGFQVIQSKTALGSGRLLGQGFLLGSQTSNRILTQASTDFIFASIGEQFGFLGSIMILTLYFILIIRIIYIGNNANSLYGTFVAIGIAIMILLHIFINIGMNEGALPVTGIPLPLISYGGSSIFVIMISLGLVQSIGRSKRSIDIADDLMLRSRSLTI